MQYHLEPSLLLNRFMFCFATSKDIEVSVRKKHLHVWWAVNTLIGCCRKQNIDIGTITY